MRAPCAKLYLSPRSLYQRPPGATTWQEQTGCHRRTDTLRHGPVIGHETDGDNHSPTSSLPLSLFAMGTSYRITRAWTTETRYGMSAESVSLSQISSDIINTVRLRMQEEINVLIKQTQVYLYTYPRLGAMLLSIIGTLWLCCCCCFSFFPFSALAPAPLKQKDNYYGGRFIINISSVGGKAFQVTQVTKSDYFK